MHLEYTGLFIGELRSRENHNVVFPYFLIFLSFCVPCFDTGKRTLEATLKGGSQSTVCVECREVCTQQHPILTLPMAVRERFRLKLCISVAEVLLASSGFCT